MVDERQSEPTASYKSDAVDSAVSAASQAGTAATEAYNAAQQSEQSGAAASSAAIDATIAAAAAEAAAINQGQLIETVTAAAREDAERARSQAEQAANEAHQQAELATTVAELTLAKVAEMLEEHNSRIGALESRPVVEQNNNGVSTINPQAVENGAREQSMSDGEETKSSGRKAHGRRGR